MGLFILRDLLRDTRSQYRSQNGMRAPSFGLEGAA